MSLFYIFHPNTSSFYANFSFARGIDWELEEKTLPQPRGTLEKCVNKNAPTTQVICEWHDRVVESFKKRKLATSV
jgi:hypothetical protein